MSAFLKLLIAITVLIFSSPSYSDNLDITGEWQLVSAQLTIGENTFPTFDPKTHQMMKVITKTHFTFVSKGPVRPKFSSYSLSDSEKITAFENFGGGAGKYSLVGSEYTEHVEYSQFPNYEGQSLTFTISVEGDTLTQEGLYPLKRLGLGKQDGYVKEVYRRIK